MTKTDKTELNPEATELDEKDLDQAQAGFLADGVTPNTSKAPKHRSRGNNIFGFEDLPNN